MDGKGSRKPGKIIPLFIRQPRKSKTDGKKPGLPSVLRSKGRDKSSDGGDKGLKNSPSEDSDVVSLRRGFHGRDVVVDKKYPKEVSKEACIALLDDMGPVSKELATLLRIPDKIYMLGGDPPSFSSQPDKDAARIAGYLLLPTLKPKDAPEYALHIRSRGSNVFCTFVDKKRKIIVHETVNSMYANEGSWEFFERALKEAIATVKEYESQGVKFDFVLNKESTTKIWTL